MANFEMESVPTEVFIGNLLQSSDPVHLTDNLFLYQRTGERKFAADITREQLQSFCTTGILEHTFVTTESCSLVLLSKTEANKWKPVGRFCYYVPIPPRNDGVVNMSVSTPFELIGIGNQMTFSDGSQLLNKGDHLDPILGHSLEALFLNNDYRRQGLGTFLIQTLGYIARKRGYSGFSAHYDTTGNEGKSLTGKSLYARALGIAEDATIFEGADSVFYFPQNIPDNAIQWWLNKQPYQITGWS